MIKTYSVSLVILFLLSCSLTPQDQNSNKTKYVGSRYVAEVHAKKSCFNNIKQLLYKSTDPDLIISEIEEAKNVYFDLHLDLNNFQSLHPFNSRVTQKRDAIRSIRKKIQSLQSKLYRSGKGYKTIQMEYSYIGETNYLALDPFFKDKRIYYLNEAEREQFKVNISKDGTLRWSNGSRISTRSRNYGHSGMGIFVMDNEGNIYLHVDYKNQYNGEGYIRHSSFLSGLPISAAGELLIENGILKTVTRKSGHYTPSKSINNQLLHHLENEGVDLSEVDSIKGY